MAVSKLKVNLVTMTLDDTPIREVTSTGERLRTDPPSPKNGEENQDVRSALLGASGRSPELKDVALSCTQQPGRPETELTSAVYRFTLDRGTPERGRLPGPIARRCG